MTVRTVPTLSRLDETSDTSNRWASEDARILSSFQDPDREANEAAAADHTTSPEKLADLVANSTNWYVLIAASVNPNTPEATLLLLADNEDSVIRGAIGHRAKWASVLEKISTDPDWEVRASLLRNPHTPRAVLQDLSMDFYFAWWALAEWNRTNR